MAGERLVGFFRRAEKLDGPSRWCPCRDFHGPPGRRAGSAGWGCGSFAPRKASARGRALPFPSGHAGERVELGAAHVGQGGAGGRRAAVGFRSGGEGLVRIAEGVEFVGVGEEESEVGGEAPVVGVVADAAFQKRPAFEESTRATLRAAAGTAASESFM